MSKKRKQYYSEFKAKVALAAIQGEETALHLSLYCNSIEFKSAWMVKVAYYDNIFVERLWRTVKYEHLYIQAFNNLKEIRSGLIRWFNWYNQERFHQGLYNQTPDEVYYQKQLHQQAA